MKYLVNGYMLLLLYLPILLVGQRLLPPRNSYLDEDDDDEDQLLINGSNKDKEYNLKRNSTDEEKGTYIGAPCEFVCSTRLQFAYCNPTTHLCDCEKKYPVKLDNPYSGCTKARKLGEQCYFNEACKYNDQHATCLQIHHNAICQCENGFHSVSVQKPSKRMFCAEDLQMTSSDFSTFAGVLSGIALISGLICFVLHLFNQNLYGTGHQRHRFGNANLAPPILYSSDPGSLPLPILARASASSRASTRLSGSTSTRRTSSVATLHRVGGVATVPQSRTGSRRPSITSVHSSSSIRSYSARRYEKEREQKQEREMQRRLSKMASISLSTSKIPPTPSPHSTDDLLPTLEEDKQVPPLAAKEDSTTSFQEETFPSTSKQLPNSGV